jgi:anaerobic selenocysteine-containing dehydrogenase
VLFINPDDLAALDLQDGDLVDIETVWNDGITRKVSGFKIVPYNIPRGNLAAYYPETNPLVPLTSIGDGTGTPTSKFVPVKISRSHSVESARIA